MLLSRWWNMMVVNPLIYFMYKRDENMKTPYYENDLPVGVASAPPPRTPLLVCNKSRINFHVFLQSLKISVARSHVQHHAKLTPTLTVDAYVHSSVL